MTTASRGEEGPTVFFVCFVAWWSIFLSNASPASPREKGVATWGRPYNRDGLPTPGRRPDPQARRTIVISDLSLAWKVTCTICSSRPYQTSRASSPVIEK